MSPQLPFRVVLALACLSCSLLSRRADAEQPNTHDGLFLRFAGGFGLAADPAKVESPGVDVTGTLSGNGFAWDLAVGGTPSPGLVLGGGLFGAHIPGPVADDMKATVGGLVDLGGDVEFESLTFGLLAPFVDYYPSPEKGLHLTAAVGLGLLAVGDGKLQDTTYVPFQDHGGTGIGALAGVGYEWWVANQWSLGVVAHVTYAAPAGDDDGNTDWQHHLWLPALLVSATWQ